MTEEMKPIYYYHIYVELSKIETNGYASPDVSVKVFNLWRLPLINSPESYEIMREEVKKTVYTNGITADDYAITIKNISLVGWDQNEITDLNILQQAAKSSNNTKGLERAEAFKNLTRREAIKKHPELRATYETEELLIKKYETDLSNYSGEMPAGHLENFTSQIKTKLCQDLEKGEVHDTKSTQLLLQDLKKQEKEEEESR